MKKKQKKTFKKKKDAKDVSAKDKVLSKFTTGREKAHNKRKKTLFLEYKLKDKVNQFVDKRIGENKKGMTAEDKILARFTAQRIKSHKKTMYNLDTNEDTLTHAGRALEQIEKFEDPRSDDDDDEHSGKLDANFVSKAHFGGGLLSKVPQEQSSHKDIIDQLITDSKIRKSERQVDRNLTTELTEDLDKNLKDILPMVKLLEKTKYDFEPKGKDKFDELVRELKFEPIGIPSNRTKSDEEMKNETNVKHKKLEMERIKRMKRPIECVDDDENEYDLLDIKKHRSADDLDDGFEIDMSDENSSVDGEDDEENENEETSAVNETNEEISENSSSKTTNHGIPTSLKELNDLLNVTPLEKQSDVIGNILKNNQTNVAGNKDKLINLFGILLQYIDETSRQRASEASLLLLSQLSGILYDLSQHCAKSAATFVSDLLKNKRTEYSELSKPNATIDILIVLKLVPLLFPTSDYYHPVATPAIVFLSEILSRNSYKKASEITTGLFCTTLLLEYVELSERFCPEVLAFLHGILHIASPNSKRTYLPQFSSCKKLLKLTSKINSQDLQLKFEDLNAEKKIDDAFKVRALYVTGKLLKCFLKHWNNLESSQLVWSPFLEIIEGLPLENYPDSFQKEMKDLEEELKTRAKAPLNYLVFEKKRPKALRLYEPNIRKVIDGRSFKTVSQEKREHDKLVHKYKREMKGAVREIKKDKNFIARIKFREQDKSDAERRSKVKQIYGWGESQQSELNRMERKNRFRR